MLPSRGPAVSGPRSERQGPGQGPEPSCCLPAADCVSGAALHPPWVLTAFKVSTPGDASECLTLWQV